MQNISISWKIMLLLHTNALMCKTVLMFMVNVEIYFDLCPNSKNFA